ncbi:transposase [Ignavibacterium album]|uniref:transposase n=1 Tax=Ignavibacterium album TaxID=591197 RepID=UPI0002FD8730|nr:transposase [Ignavibacterium album]
MQVLREHLENQVSVVKICEQYNINPNLFYLWKKELLINVLPRMNPFKSVLICLIRVPIDF